MAYPQIVKWDAPAEAALCNVADGVVVRVRIAPQAGAADLGPDATGVLPHLVYYPTREPVGTTGFYLVDPGGMPTGDIVYPRPRVEVTSSFPEKRPGYWINLNCAFKVPWPGHITIAGGAAAGGLPSPQDVEIVVSRPELSGEEFDSMVAVGNRYREMRAIRFQQNGAVPLKNPTITFQGIGATYVPIPHGARSIQVASSIGLTFNFRQTPTSAPVPIRVDAGPPIDIGYLAGGSFNCPAGGGAPLVVFEVDLA